METQLIGVDTSGRRIADLTGSVVSFCEGRGDGLVHVFAPHATAGIALMEMGSGSESDLIAAIEHLLPRDDRYRHRHGATGHGADHVLPAFLTSLPRLKSWDSWPLMRRPVGFALHRVPYFWMFLHAL